jgi:5-oxoprolinase (ATP-hydrolysing)
MTSPNETHRTMAASHFIGPSPCPPPGDFRTQFEQQYKQEFGFILPSRDILIDDVRVRGVGVTKTNTSTPTLPPPPPPSPHPSPSMHVDVWFEDSARRCVKVSTPVYDLGSILIGQTVNGPALILDNNNSIVVEPDCHASLTHERDVIIVLGDGKPTYV